MSISGTDFANGDKACWTGYTRWYEEGFIAGTMEGSYVSGDAFPQRLTFYETQASGDIKAVNLRADASDTVFQAKVTDYGPNFDQFNLSTLVADI